MIGLTHYAAIHNNYCLAYFGLVPEYVVQLRMLRPLFKSQFPELCLSIACRDELTYFLENEVDIIPYSMMRDRKNHFAYIREIATNLNSPHSLYQLTRESISELEIKGKHRHQVSNRCLICPDGAFPTKSYSDVNKLKTYAEMKNYRVCVAGSDIHPGPGAVDIRPVGKEKLALVAKADWIIAVENEYLFEGVRLGVKTTLIPTGLGTDLYRFLCPEGEIFPE